MVEGVKMLSEQERMAWLRLFRSENIGVRNFNLLLGLFGSAEEALKRAPDMSLKGGRKKPIRIYTMAEAEREWQACQKVGAQLVARCEPTYSRLLARIKDAPPLLTVLGNVSLLSGESVAIVGARNASANGCRFAQVLAEDLGKKGYVVTSGLARGIDTNAHRGALKTGTVAVIAGGIDTIYPPENHNLRDAIAETGAIVAELPFGTVPRGQHFPQRNRIISGLSLGTVVVEATFGSGSLITARMALEQGREVMAVPGSPLDPRCKGTNDLIRQGATMVESAQDVIAAITSFSNPLDLGERDAVPFTQLRLQPAHERDLEAARKEITRMLGAAPVGVDDLVSSSGVPLGAVLTVLLELELAGRLERHPGNKVSLIFTTEDLFEEVF